MTQLLVRRILLSIPLVFIVSTIVFVMESLVPGNAAVAILGANYDQHAYAALVKQLGLNLPVYEQYARWLGGAVHGSLGSSIFNNQPVVTILNERLGVTVSLIICTVIVTGLAGMGLGIVSAVRPGRVLGRFVDVLTMVGLALPSFWVGLVLIELLAVRVHLLPTSGYIPLNTSPGNWARSLILPVFALSLGPLATIGKQTRDSMMDALDREFVWALRARGIRERTIIFRHALRSGALPVVTVLGLLFIGLLGGTVVVETVFALPGIGSLAVQATMTHDLPVVQGVAVYFTLIVVVSNLLIDLLYGWINPRARLE